MFDSHTTSLLVASTLATRPEYRIELTEELRKMRELSSANREELYEVFLQTYLFAGFPAALESVRTLSKVFGHEERDAKSEAAIIAEYNSYLAQGALLYKKVYACNAQKVREEMLRLSPELAAWAMIEGYGKTLSRPQLDAKTRELCIVASLTQLGWERQLYSHILGARNVGAEKDDILEAARIGAKGDKKKVEIAEQLVKKIV
jgi:alkylhydroperoxidase/carboxymuconolactone decarboxylase family protein YurZ